MDVLETKEVNYFRGVNGSLYFSVQLLLNGEYVAFYNEEMSCFEVIDNKKERFFNAIDAELRRYDLANNRININKIIKNLINISRK